MDNKLKEVVLDYLRNSTKVDFSLVPIFYKSIAFKCYEKGYEEFIIDRQILIINEHNVSLKEEYMIIVNHIIWDLIINKVLRPGSASNSSLFDLPEFHITEYGKQFLLDLDNK